MVRERRVALFGRVNFLLEWATLRSRGSQGAREGSQKAPNQRRPPMQHRAKLLLLRGLVLGDAEIG
jgi:hypothetical protein